MQTTHPKQVYRKMKPVIMVRAVSRAPKPHTAASTASVKLTLQFINSKRNQFGIKYTTEIYNALKSKNC